MHNSLTLKRQGYLLTNKYIHYICADKINAMIKTNPVSYTHLTLPTKLEV